MKNVHILPTGEKFAGISAENIYITSDEEIKEGNYWYDYLLETINKGNLVGKQRGKKIIITTDQELIKDGVQAIDDEFLEWFVKNPSCEKVEVEKLEGRYVDYSGNVHIPINYKIIIPKEEAKQDEIDFIANELDIEKQRSYCEEEVKRLAFKFYLEMSKQMNVPHNLITENYTNVDEWFEQLNPIKAYYQQMDKEVHFNRGNLNK